MAGTSEDVATDPEQAASLIVEDEERKQKLWRYLIMLILGLFAFETVLANRKVSSVRQRSVKRET